MEHLSVVLFQTALALTALAIVSYVLWLTQVCAGYRVADYAGVRDAVTQKPR